MGEIVKEKSIWGVACVCFLAMAATAFTYEIALPLETGSFAKIFQSALLSKTILFLLPVASVLPAGASYVKESESGFLKLYIARISRMEYIKKKTILLYASGFIPFFLSGASAFAVSFLVFYPLELKGDISQDLIMEPAQILFRICLVAGILAEISGIFAALFQNYYMAYGLPFVCFYLLIILKERYLPWMYTVYPSEWIAAKENWGVDQKGIWLFLFAFGAAAMLLHGLLLYKRIEEI